MGSERDHGSEPLATTVVVILAILAGILTVGGGLLYFARSNAAQARMAAAAMAERARAEAQRAEMEVQRAEAQRALAQASRTVAASTNSSSVVLQLSADGAVTLDGAAIAVPDLKAALGADVAAKSYELEVSSECPWQKVVDVISVLLEAGARTLHLSPDTASTAAAVSDDAAPADTAPADAAPAAAASAPSP
jgi:biopolymer transport protein ExbD